MEMAAIVLSLMLPLPLFMYRIVAERNSGMSSMIYQNGMRPFAYWFSNFLADLLVYFIVLIPVIVVGVRPTLQSAHRCFLLSSFFF